MRLSRTLALLAALWSGWCGASQSQFYVFPVKELDGISSKIAPESRTLIDERVRSVFTPEVQAAILAGFSKALTVAFPESTVHAQQVFSSLKGQYQFIDAPMCGEGFAVPVDSSYAAVVGLTRGSWYEVERDGGRVEILIPITLNLQLIKPDLSKVVYSISETLYSPFIFTKDEIGKPAMTAKLAEVVVKGLNIQIASLVETLKANFKPKDVPIKVVGRERGLFVVDRGFEVGFTVDEELTAANLKGGALALFRVISVDSGYAILKLIQGSAEKGDSFVFTFESPADDSRKPRVMPVTDTRSGGQTAAVVADLFSKSIGFKAGFQLSPVNANFSQTMTMIRFAASCVPWDKYPSTKQIFESRTDAPDFFMKFSVAKSPVVRQSGVGAVKTIDSFVTTVTAQLVDKSGNVIFSDIASDKYVLEKTGGQGLSIANAEEISLKNATIALANAFVKNAKFENGNFKISGVGKSTLNAEGLNLPAGMDPGYEIVRQFETKVNGAPVYMRVAVDKGTAGPAPVANGMAFSYSKIEFAPENGDVLRVFNMPKAGQTRLSECATSYKAANSVPAEYLIPMVRHAAYKSAKFQPILNEPAFYVESNNLLKAGFFKLQMGVPQVTEQCIKAGYSVVPQPETCQENLCSMKSLFATTLILEKDGVRVGNYVQAETVTFDGFSKSEATNFVGFKAYESALKNLPKLTDSTNISK